MWHAYAAAEFSKGLDLNYKQLVTAHRGCLLTEEDRSAGLGLST